MENTGKCFERWHFKGQAISLLLSILCIIILSVKLFICPELTHKWISSWHFRVPTVAVTSSSSKVRLMNIFWVTTSVSVVKWHTVCILYNDNSDPYVRPSICTVQEFMLPCSDTFSSFKSLCFHGYWRLKEAGRSWIYTLGLYYLDSPGLKSLTELSSI